MRKNIYCFCETILLFLSHNKLFINDQINCFVLLACIFLFLTKIQMVCQFCLYIFVSTTTYQILFIVSEGILMLYVDPIYCYYSSTCIFLFSTIIPTVWDLYLYIFVLDNNLQDRIYCYWITVNNLFQSN